MPGEPNFEAHYQVLYQKNLGAELQQADQRLKGVVDDEYNFSGQPGTYFTADFVGLVEVTPIIDRDGDTPSGQAPARRRRGAFFTSHEVNTRLGTTLDNARTVIDPSSKIIQAERKGIARFHDRQIALACMAPALQAPDGSDAPTTSVPFNTNAYDNATPGFVIPADDHSFDTGTGNVGLTASKVQKAHELLKTAEIDDALYCIAPQRQKSKLINEQKLSNSDYAVVKALVNGEINQWHGFTFVDHYENLNAQAAKAGIAVPNGFDVVLFVAKNSVQYRSRVLLAPEVYRRQEKRMSWWTHGQMESAGVRVHDEGVLLAFCKR